MSEEAGGGLLSMMKGWAKFKPPPNFVQKEEQLKTMDPGEKLSMAYVMEQLDILIKNSTGSMKSQFEYVKADLIIDQKKNAYAEEFIEEFILWILGRSCKNVRYEHQEFNPNGQRVIDVDDPKEVTPWGNTPYTHLDDVKDFLDQIVDNRMAAIKYITKLKLRYPRNLADLWFWWKYIVHKQGVDGAIINYARWLEPYDFIPPDKVPYDPQTGTDAYIYYGGEDKWQDPQQRVGISPVVDDYNLVNPNPPPYYPERARYLVDQLFDQMNTGLGGGLTIDEFVVQFTDVFNKIVRRNAYAFCKMDLENIKTRMEADVMASNLSIEDKQILLGGLGFYNPPDQRTQGVEDLSLLLRTHLAGVTAALNGRMPPPGQNIINNNFTDTTPILREIKTAIENGNTNLWNSLNGLSGQINGIASGLAWDAGATSNFRQWMGNALTGINNTINSKNNELKVVVENMSGVPPAPPVVNVAQQLQPLQENRNIVNEIQNMEVPVDLSGLETSITNLTTAITSSNATSQEVLNELREFTRNAPEGGATKAEIGVLFNNIVDRVNGSSASYFKAILRDLKRAYGSQEVKAAGITKNSIEDLVLLQNQVMLLQQQRMGDVEKINSLSTQYKEIQNERESLKLQADQLRAAGNQVLSDKQTLENLSGEQASEIVRLREENKNLSVLASTGGSLSDEAKQRLEANERELSLLKNSNSVNIKHNEELQSKINTQAEELKRAKQTLNNAITNHELKTNELDQKLSESRKVTEKLTAELEQTKLNWDGALNNLKMQYESELKSSNANMRAELTAAYNAEKAKLEESMRKEMETKSIINSPKITEEAAKIEEIKDEIIIIGKEKEEAEKTFKQQSESARQRQKEIDDILALDISLLEDTVELSVSGVPMDKKVYDPRTEAGYMETDEQSQYEEVLKLEQAVLEGWDTLAEQKSAENFLVDIVNGFIAEEGKKEPYWDYFLKKSNKEADIHGTNLEELDMDWEGTYNEPKKEAEMYGDYLDNKIKKMEEKNKQTKLRLSMARGMTNDTPMNIIKIINLGTQTKWANRGHPGWSPNEKTSVAWKGPWAQRKVAGWSPTAETAAAWAGKAPNPLLANPTTGEMKTIENIQEDQEKLVEVAEVLEAIQKEEEEELSELKRQKSSQDFTEKYTNADYISDDPVTKMNPYGAQDVVSGIKQVLAQIMPTEEVAKTFGYKSMQEFEQEHTKYLEQFIGSPVANDPSVSPQDKFDSFFRTMSKIYYDRDLKNKNQEFLKGFLESIGGNLGDGLDNFVRDTGSGGITESYPQVAEAWKNLRPSPGIVSMHSKYNPSETQENHYYSSSRSFLDLIARMENHTLPLTNILEDFGKSLSSSVPLNVPNKVLEDASNIRQYFLDSIHRDIDSVLKPPVQTSRYISNVQDTLYNMNTILKTVAMKSGFNPREIVELDLDEYNEDEKLAGEPRFEKALEWSKKFLSEARPLLQSNIRERSKMAREAQIRRGTNPEYYFSGSEFSAMTRDIYKSPRGTTQFVVPTGSHGQMSQIEVSPEESKAIFKLERHYKEGRIDEEKYRFGITNIFKKYTDRAPMTVDQMANFINPGAGIPINDIQRQIPISEEERARRREVARKASQSNIEAAKKAIKFPHELQVGGFGNSREMEIKRAEYVERIVAQKYDNFVKEKSPNSKRWDDIPIDDLLETIKDPEKVQKLMRVIGVSDVEMDYAERYLMHLIDEDERKKREAEEANKMSYRKTLLQRKAENPMDYVGTGKSLQKIKE